MTGKISEGAEAVIYETEVLDIPAVVKDRIKKEYRIAKLDDEIRRARTKKEARILALASSKGVNVPRVLLVEEHRLYLTKLDGGTLNVLKPSKKAFGDAGRMLAKLHNINVSHGDYTPANLLLDKSGRLWIIDFGLAEITNSVEEKALDILLMKRSVGKAEYRDFAEAYAKGSDRSEGILERLGEIERRGRYQTRTLLTG